MTTRLRAALDSLLFDDDGFVRLRVWVAAGVLVLGGLLVAVHQTGKACEAEGGRMQAAGKVFYCAKE